MKKNVRYLVAISAMGLLVQTSCTSTQPEVGDLNVIPQPQEVQMQVDEPPFVLTEGVKILYPSGNDKLQKTAQFLSASIRQSTGLTLPVTEEYAENQVISLSVDTTLTEMEGYQLSIDQQHVELIGGSEAGVFHGIQTLYKSIPTLSSADAVAALPAGTVTDYPRFDYRGFMLDVGRHYFPVSYIKQIIDMLALHNINYFHWHLTEDQGWRIEIKKYPKLTEIGSKRPRSLVQWKPMKYNDVPHSGFYTQEEAKEIVRYAAERYITVIPEVDMPGHMMAALVSYPELGCTGGPYEIPCRWGVFDDVLCGGNDKALTFAKDVLNEIMDIFPSHYIHIGGDECPKKHWKVCPKCQAKIRSLRLKDQPDRSKENQLQTYFMGEVAKLIESRGRQMMGWDEMMHGGLYPNSTVMAWTHPSAAVKAARLHHDCIITPIQYFYFSNPGYNKLKGIHSVSRVYHFEPVSKELSEEDRKYMIGAQGCLWTEWTEDSTKMEWQLMPRLAALSEVQWTEPNSKNFDSFLSRLNPMLKVYASRGYEYRQDIHGVTVTVKADTVAHTQLVSLRTIDNALIRYTLDGTEPTAQSAVYAEPFAVENECVLKTAPFREGVMGEVTEQEIKLLKAEK